jgi:monoamine oxidase
MGTFIQSFAHGVPIQLGQAVQQVSYDDNGVRIVASGQEYRARTAIVTVPTSVLQGQGIAFNPPLPQEKVEALSNLPMGHFKKIFLEYAPDTFPEEASHCAVYDLDESRAAYLVGVGGKKGLVFAMCGGELSKTLEEKGEHATIEFMRKQLKKIFGPEVDEGYLQGFVSKWESDAFSKGAYAVARPGHSHARETAREPMGRVSFAGEAYDMNWPTYLPGAFATGQQAAQEVLEWLKKDEAS